MKMPKVVSSDLFATLGDKNLQRRTQSQTRPFTFPYGRIADDEIVVHGLARIARRLGITGPSRPSDDLAGQLPKDKNEQLANTPMNTKTLDQRVEQLTFLTMDLLHAIKPFEEGPESDRQYLKERIIPHARTYLYMVSTLANMLEGSLIVVKAMFSSDLPTRFHKPPKQSPDPNQAAIVSQADHIIDIIITLANQVRWFDLKGPDAWEFVRQQFRPNRQYFDKARNLLGEWGQTRRA